ncbi:MAG: DMT family transporter [Betaproteobacteria bacterium]|nr:DMT family transporter [Betaproteobacteria bacterium]
MSGTRFAIPAAAIWLLVGLVLGWGMSWPLMKLALSEMPPLRFRAFAVGVGTIGLFAAAWISGARLALPRGALSRIAGVAFFNSIAWSVSMAYGLRLVDSGRAAIVVYTFPVWSIPLGAWLLGEPITRRRLAGLVLGMSGMALLLGGELHAVGRAPLGALLLLGTAASWAVGTVLMKRWAVDVPASAYTAWMSLIAFVPLLAATLLLERGPLHPFGLSAGPMFGAFYSALIAALFCQWAWLRLVRLTSAGVASLSILAVPVVGVASGMVLLGERPGASDIGALALVLASLGTVVLPSRTRRAPG